MMVGALTNVNSLITSYTQWLLTGLCTTYPQIGLEIGFFFYIDLFSHYENLYLGLRGGEVFASKGNF
jgi:hypothetical protein